jgi:hypothetical protein
MKLDFLDEVNEYGDQLIRLYNFDSIQANKLYNAIKTTIIENKASLDINALDFIESINCRLIMHLADEDEGILTMDDKLFFCDLTIAGYQNMLRLMEPFCLRDTRRSQLLYELDTQIDLLFAPYAETAE